MKIENLHTWDTKHNADSVEWCPIANFQHVFVCGTYQLEKSDGSTTSAPLPQNRQGLIYLFKIENDPIQLILNHTLASSGVLDQKWSQFPIAGDPLLAVVDSIGDLKIYKLTTELHLVLSSEIRVCDGLALSLDWSTGKYASNEPKIAVSDSKGHVSIYILKESGLERLTHLKAHDFEAWICAFNYWDPQLFFTGGDDCKLNVFDMRSGETAIMVNKSHTSGVTSFHSNKLNDSGLISGSYDETLRKWDLRKFKNPIAEMPLGGGIWRLKWHPNRNDLVLAACMYGGFRIVEERESAFNVVAEYNAHESIAYGADWSHTNSLFATCSFYDNKLHLNKLIL